MGNPLITLIIPVYNVEDYIERCLESVFEQTYTNLEILIIDDCSPDNSIERIKSLMSKYAEKCCRIIRHESNKGLSAARNTGILEANGDYLYFLDSDDEIKTNAIAVLTNLIINKDVELVQGNYEANPENWFTFNLIKDLRYGNVINDQFLIKSMFLRRDYLPVMAWNKLISRDFLIKHNLFFKRGVIHEDEHWNFFLAKYLKCVVICQIPTYIYHKNRAGITLSKSFREKSFNSYKLILDDFAKNVDEFCEREQIDHVIHLSYKYFLELEDIYFIKLLRPILKTSMLKRAYDMLEWGESKRILSKNVFFYLIKSLVKFQKK